MLLFVMTYLALCVYCAFKENATTAKYQTFGVYGRFKAYLFVDMIAAGVVFILMAFTVSLPQRVTDMLAFLAIGAICIIIAFLIFRFAKSKCPEGDLRDKLLISMIITGMGITVKLVVCFISAIWTIVGPKKMVNDEGKTIYVFNDGDVYDELGNIIGKQVSGNKYIEFKKKY